jgi:mannose-1-phosphate guanylyltransferase/mannose-6-phosphate isomerase
MIIPVILSGGSGSRLWPLSRKAYPKQFLDLAGEQSLFAATCERFGSDVFTAPIIICNEEHRFLVAETLREQAISDFNIILEPIGRNTAPACALAALQAMHQADDPLILIAPSDHLIRDEQAFIKTVTGAIKDATNGQIVTFGVQPDHPHTGYGYIELSNDQQSADAPVPVKAFHEKPDLETATQYLESGKYVWNAGIFLVKASILLKAFETLQPDMLEACKTALDNAQSDLDFIRIAEGDYEAVEANSIDYAIIEKATNIACMPLQSDWNDLGSWSSLMDVMPKDTHENVLFGDVVLEDTQSSLVYADHGCLAVVGGQNLVIVQTKDATLVTTKDRSQDVRAIVEKLKLNQREETDFHTRVHRPWGWYERLSLGHRYQVKCIMVKPGSQLSLQSHMHRAEHWIVVEGTIEVTRNEETLLLTENQSTYIPLGARHRMANPGKVPAFLIEVQSGSYLGEDDIIRYEDKYGRA